MRPRVEVGILFSLMLCGLVSAETSASESKHRMERARMVARMEALGFDCCVDPISDGFSEESCRVASSRSQGDICVGHVQSYPLPVALLIPPDFKPGAHTDVISYFHGNNVSGQSLVWYLKNQELAESLVRSRRNAVMVVPLARGGKKGTDEYDLILAAPQTYGIFLSEVVSVLQKAGLALDLGLGSITLAGHSGAYRVMTEIAKSHERYSSKIREFYCLDCIYWKHDDFVNFAKLPDRRFWAVYSDEETDADTSCVMSRLTLAGIHYFGCAPRVETCPEPGSNDTPPGLENASCPPAQKPSHASRGEFAKNRVGFLYSTFQHDDIPSAYLGRLLRGEP